MTTRVNKPSASQAPHLSRWTGGSLLNTASKLFLVIVFGLVAALILDMAVIEPYRPVAQVQMNNGTIQKIRTRNFQRRLRFERIREVNHQKAEGLRKGALWDWQVQIDYRTLSELGFAGGILDRMTREVLIREAAAQRGLKVSEAEIDLLIKQARAAAQVTRSPATTVTGKPGPVAAITATPSSATLAAATPAAAAAPSLVAASGTTATATTGVTPEDTTVLGVALEDLPANYRDIIRDEILETKLEEVFFEGIPVKQDQVQLKLIRFEFEKDARDAAAMNSDKTFDDLYKNVLGGTVKGGTGTMRGWSSSNELTRDLNESFSKAAFHLAAGQHFTEPIPAARGWYLAEALGHEIRTMSEEWRRQRGKDGFDDWLAHQQARVTQFPIWMKRVPLMDELVAQGLDAMPPPPMAGSSQGKAGNNGGQSGQQGGAGKGPVLPSLKPNHDSNSQHSGNTPGRYSAPNQLAPWNGGFSPGQSQAPNQQTPGNAMPGAGSPPGQNLAPNQPESH